MESEEFPTSCFSCFPFRMDEDAKWLSRFEKRFHHFSGEDNLIQLDEFIKVLEVKEVSA